MNPLVVARSVGELVDGLLRDGVPVAHGDFGADAGGEIGQGVENSHDRLVLYLFAARLLSSQAQSGCHCSRSFSTRPGATSNTVNPRAAR